MATSTAIYLASTIVVAALGGIWGWHLMLGYYDKPLSEWTLLEFVYSTLRLAILIAVFVAFWPIFLLFLAIVAVIALIYRIFGER